MNPRERRRPVAATSCLALAVAGLLAGCVTPAKNTATAAAPAPTSAGAAGGGTAVGGDANLQTCTQTVGTVRLQDAQASASTAGQMNSPAGAQAEGLRLLMADLRSLKGGAGGGSGASPGVTIEALRLLIQQSNCLLIVDRGEEEAATRDEKRRTRDGGNEVADGANMGPGQEVAADFVLRARVLSVNANEKSSGINAGALVPWKWAQSVSASQTLSSAEVQLVLSDVRRNIQLAVSQGRGEGKSTQLASKMLARLGPGGAGGGAGTQSNTSPQKVLLQAYADAYNKLVPALERYKMQVVQGGLGKGGTLGVQGAQTDPSAVKK